MPEPGADTVEVIRVTRNTTDGWAGLGLKLAWREYGMPLPLPSEDIDFNDMIEGSSDYNVSSDGMC